MIVGIYIEGQRLDLFQDESIIVRQGVQDVRDISKLFADYSQSFTVPASRRNNRIFKQFYNFNIDNGYDARVRKTASIEVDTLDFKFGKIRLNSAKVKENKPTSYSLTFFGDAVKIKDLLGEDKLSSLSWLDNFDHAFNDTNVKTGLTNGLDFTVSSTAYNDAVIYPLISYKRQWLINSDSSDTTSTDTLVNIDYDAARTDGIDFKNLKPCIKVDLIKKAIEQKYELEFVGTFFQSDLWQQMYMNLQNDTSSLAAGSLEYESTSGTIDYSGIGTITGLRVRYQAIVTPASGFESVPYKIKFTNNGSTVYESSVFVTGTQTLYHEFDQTVTQTNGYEYDYSFTAECITEQAFTFGVNQRLSWRRLGLFIDDSWTNISNNDYLSQAIVLTAQITKLFQDIEVYEWLTSILKMFNLVVVPVENQLYIQDLQTWYEEGQVYDVSKYIDPKEHNVERGKIYNLIEYTFEESDQILAEEFLQNSNKPYGNLENRLFDANGEVLDGGKLTIETIFENPIYERLYNQDDASLTDVQYCAFVDKDIEGYTGKPFLLYAPLVDVSSDTLGYKNSSSYEELSSSVRMPSHSMQIDTDSFNLNFDAEVNEYTYQVFEDTIYNRFWSDYVGDIFSIKRRLVKMEGLLPNNLLHNLNLNDRLVINDNRFIINSISSDLVNRKDTLELINDIYDAPLPNDELNTSVFRTPYNVVSARGGEFTIRYFGKTGQSVALIADGYGTSWVTLNTTTTSGTITEISYTVSVNTSGADRQVLIRVNDKIKNPYFSITQRE